MDKWKTFNIMEKPVSKVFFFCTILLRPKTVLLLKEFIVKYSPFIQHNFGQMVKMNRKTTASDGVAVCLDLKNKLMFEEKTIILYCCVIHLGRTYMHCIQWYYTMIFIHEDTNSMLSYTRKKKYFVMQYNNSEQRNLIHLHIWPNHEEFYFLRDILCVLWLLVGMLVWCVLLRLYTEEKKKVSNPKMQRNFNYFFFL